MEVEQVERHDLRRLRQQRAGRARVGRRNRINRDDASAGGDAKRACAQAIFAGRGERQSKRRMRKAARDRKQNEQDREAVERRIALPGEADREQSEHRRHREIEPVRAAGEPAVAVGELPEHERDAERHHEPRQVAASEQERRSDEADEGGDARAKGEPEERVGEALACENGRGVSAEAKERRVSERDDSGQSENEVER